LCAAIQGEFYIHCCSLHTEVDEAGLKGRRYLLESRNC
jgi:hypothetical protein